MGIGYICQYHEIAVPKHAACEKCMAERAELPAAETMTAEEKAVEFEMWLNREQLTVDWDTFKGRLDALLGRDLFTHELASNNQENLLAEMKGKKPHPQFLDEIVSSLPAHLRDNVIPVDMGDDGAPNFSGD